jgi:hypothetical protein
MSNDGTSLKDRLARAADARSAMLEKFKRSLDPDNPAAIERRRQREVLAAARKERAAQRDAARREQEQEAARQAELATKRLPKLNASPLNKRRVWLLTRPSEKLDSRPSKRSRAMRAMPQGRLPRRFLGEDTEHVGLLDHRALTERLSVAAGLTAPRCRSETLRLMIDGPAPPARFAGESHWRVLAEEEEFRTRPRFRSR